MEEGDELGNQMGAAYVKRDLMRDLKVIVMSFLLLAPGRAS